MSDCAVRFEGVGKRYRHFEIENLSFEVSTGSVLGLIGPNGAGKSTSLRMLMGLVHQDRGFVEVLGHPMPVGQVKAKEQIGYVSEDLRLFGDATLAWHMDWIRSIYPGWDNAYADRMASRFGLKPQQKIKGMSHGERVKSSLLLVLARRPKLLVLDEPTTGLDPVARREVLTELMEVVADEERTILFSSHNTLDVEQIADQITFLDRGRLVESGNKEDFLDRWQRIRLRVPNDVSLEKLRGVESLTGNGAMWIATVSEDGAAIASVYQEAGAKVLAIDRMSLEEIFVERVMSRRCAA